MAKTLLYRLFGFGRISEKLVEEFRSEGLLFSDEGIRGTVTYLNFHGDSWRYSNWKRQWFGSAIVLTEKRLVAYRLRHPLFDVPINDPRLKEIEFSIERPETLLLAFDAAWFKESWKGRIEYRFRTPVSKDLLAELERLA